MTAGPAPGRGDIVLIAFPFTDLSSTRVRPALVLARSAGDDLILAFITSRAATTDPLATCLLRPGDPEFVQAGLRVESLIRHDRLATLNCRSAFHRLGQIGPRTAGVVDDALRYVFML